MIRALLGISGAHKEKELKTERWVYARSMYRGKGGMRYSPRYYRVFGEEIIGDVAIWDWSKPNPLIGGALKIVNVIDI